jgi:hypothetical protein
MSLLEVNKFKNINNVPNIYDLTNFEAIDEEIFVKINFLNGKIISVLFDDIKLKLDDNPDSYDNYLDMTEDLEHNGIFDMHKYKDLYDIPLNVHFTLDPNLEVILNLQEERTRIKITNKTQLDNIFIEDLNFDILNKDYRDNINEYSMCMKISKCKHTINGGNMYINTSHTIYFSSIDKYINIFEKGKTDVKYGIMDCFIPLFYTILKTVSINKLPKHMIKQLDNFHTNTETLLKKIILNVFSKNNQEIGELICELYTFNNTLYLYIIKFISNNNDVFNFHKECKSCKIKQTLKNSSVFSLYNSVCRCVIEDYMSFLKTNLNINNPMEIKISDILDKIELNTTDKYMIRPYGKYQMMFI